MINNLPTGDSRLVDYAPFSRISYIVTDLDGTLILGDEPVQKQIVNCVSNIQRFNTFFSVATGRTVYGAKRLIEKLGIKRGIPIAYYNGSVIMEYLNNIVLYVNPIEQRDLKAIFDFSRKYECSAFYYSFDYVENIVTSESVINESVFGTGTRIKEKDINNMSIKWTGDVSALIDINIISVLIDITSMDSTSLERLSSELSSVPSLSITSSGSGFIEIRSLNAGKGKIVEFLLKKCESSNKNRILSIGDNDNDIELFTKSDISVVVSNASENTKKAAQYICSHACGKGFLDLLRVVLAAKRYFD